eukprot:4814583-Pyramimonas_sp.AAC.1
MSYSTTCAYLFGPGTRGSLGTSTSAPLAQAAVASAGPAGVKKQLKSTFAEGCASEQQGAASLSTPPGQSAPSPVDR